jgi:hypothetical protein
MGNTIRRSSWRGVGRAAIVALSIAASWISISTTWAVAPFWTACKPNRQAAAATCPTGTRITDATSSRGCQGNLLHYLHYLCEPDNPDGSHVTTRWSTVQYEGRGIHLPTGPGGGPVTMVTQPRSNPRSDAPRPRRSPRSNPTAPRASAGSQATGESPRLMHVDDSGAIRPSGALTRQPDSQIFTDEHDAVFRGEGCDSTPPAPSCHAVLNDSDDSRVTLTQLENLRNPTSADMVFTESEAQSLPGTGTDTDPQAARAPQELARQQRLGGGDNSDVLRETEERRARGQGFTQRSSVGTVSERLREAGGNDPCATAAGIDRSKYGCGDTQTFMQASQATLQVGGQVGAMVVQTAGQVNQANAASSTGGGGGQAAMMRAGADTQELGGQTQRIMGGLAAVAGMANLGRGIDHGDKAGDLSREFNRSSIEGRIQRNTAGYSSAEGNGALSMRDAADRAREAREGGSVYEASATDLTDAAFSTDGSGRRNDREYGYVRGEGVGGDAGRVISDLQLNRDGTLEGLHQGVRSEAIEQARADLTAEEAQGANSQATQQARTRLNNLLKARGNEIERRTEAVEDKQAYLTRQLANAGRAASNEHGQMSQQATSTGVTQLAQGVAQFVAGQLQIDAANSMRANINELNNMESGANRFDLGGDQSADLNNGSAPSIAGTDPSSSAAAEDASESDVPTGLGDPFATDQNTGLGAGIPAPSGTGFVDRPPGAGGPGGGNGGSPNAGAAPQASASNEDPQSKYMDLRNRGGGRYETGGVGRMSGGGGMGGRGGGGGIGPDLSAMMEKFLGKKGEEGRGQGILDFGQGNGRAGEQPYSLLDRNANLFERIHQTYQDRSRRGIIGL